MLNIGFYYHITVLSSFFMMRFYSQRPRKVTAKFSGTNFAPDEHLQPELDHDFEGKRDRWNGYDLSDHKRVIEDHHKIEEVRSVGIYLVEWIMCFSK